MIAFWIAATGLSAVTAGLVLRGAAKARPVNDADTRLEPHRRRLAEVERLALDGLLSQDELKAARAEAGRGLLAAADQAEHWTAGRRWSAQGCGGDRRRGCVAAIGLYLFFGHPELPDQAFAKRVAEWKAADPATLAPDQIAAVLESVVATSPRRSSRWCSWPRPAWPAVTCPAPRRRCARPCAWPPSARTSGACWARPSSWRARRGATAARSAPKPSWLSLRR